MGNSPTVPMFSPDGQLGDIPYERMHDALAAGAKIGVNVKAPDGSNGVIPADRLQDAIKAGGKAVPYDLSQAAPKEGFFKGAGKTLGGIVAGASGMMDAGSNPASMVASAVTIGAHDVGRQLDNRSLPYRITAGAGEELGVDAKGMEDAANAGDTAGVFGHAVGSAIPAVAGAALGEIAPKVAPAAEGIKNAAKDAFQARATSAVRATIPEAASIPPKAAFGAEKIYRAAAPTGGDPMFRQQLYKAAGDLAEIGQKTQLNEAKGGIIQPDMRVRATVNAINDHLSEMYQTERAPQIERNADNPVQANFGADAQEGLDYLSRRSGKSELQGLASKALSSDSISLADADKLARLTNKELLGYESGDPAQKAVIEATNPKIGGLKSLDRELSAKIGDELQRQGEPGIGNYEQRYAALSSVRDQLQKRINAVELNQPGVIKGIVRPVTGLITGGTSGIASASQAAVADVNIGRELQLGLANLADSGIKATRANAAIPPKIRGLLTSGAIPLGQGEPASPAGPPSFTGKQASEYYPTTTPQRLNRLLPESVRAKIELQPSSLPTEGPPAMRIEPTTTPQRMGRLLPEQTGGRQTTPVPGALDFTPPARELAQLSAADAAKYVSKAKGNVQLAKQLAAHDGFRF